MRGPIEIFTGGWEWLHGLGLSAWLPAVWTGCLIALSERKTIIRGIVSPAVGALVRRWEAGAQRDASLQGLVDALREKQPQNHAGDVHVTASRPTVHPVDGTDSEDGSGTKSGAA